MKAKKCGECALQKINGVCPIFRREMPEDEAGCPMYTYDITECDICGDHIVKNAVIEEDEQGLHLMCHHCANAPMCATCVERMTCAFEQDRNCKIPPIVVVKEHPQPNMTIQKQIPNPERIKETCAKGCHCYYEAGLADGTHCIKQLPNSGCANYKTAWRS